MSGQQDQTKEATPTEISPEEIFRDIADGKAKASEVLKAETPTEKEVASEGDKTDTKAVEAETYEAYKDRTAKEIETLNKRVNDNQAAYTRKSQELAEVLKAKKELEERLAQIESDKAYSTEDVDLSAFEEYPDEMKGVIKSLTERNKALNDRLKDIDTYIRQQKNSQAEAEERSRQTQIVHKEFTENILPKIVAELPDYDEFMKANISGYVNWANSLSEGERFSFLHSKDPRDLIRGCKEYKKFLNLPYEENAIKQQNNERKEQTSLYKSAHNGARQVQPESEPVFNAQKAWEDKQKRLMENYNELIRR